MPKKVITKQEAIALERHLAAYSNMLDSLVRIPFTRQGIGADAAIGTVPVVGDTVGEPYRDCRRPFFLREYPDDNIKIYPRDQRTSSTLTS